jgi:hypothetical protein
MHLTADTYVQIVESLRSDKVGGGMREQRKRPRVGVGGRVNILIPMLGAAKAVPANVRDLSAAGVGLLLTEPLLAAGQEFLLVLPAGVQHGRRAVVYRASRVVRLGENQYLIGATLTREAKLDGTSAAPPAAGPPPANPSAAAPAKQAAPAPAAAGSAGHSAAIAPQMVMADADANAVKEVEARLRSLAG